MSDDEVQEVVLRLSIGCSTTENGDESASEDTRSEREDTGGQHGLLIKNRRSAGFKNDVSAFRMVPINESRVPMSLDPKLTLQQEFIFDDQISDSSQGLLLQRAINLKNYSLSLNRGSTLQNNEIPLPSDEAN